MTVPLTGTGGYFTRLGYVGTILDAVNLHRGTTIAADIDSLDGEYDATQQDVRDSLYSTLASYQQSADAFAAALAALASNTSIRMVDDDNPLPTPDLTLALAELVRQMGVSGDTIERPVVSAGSAAYAAGNRGTGVLFGTVTDESGLVTVSAFNETLSLICTGDAATGETNYREPFKLTTPAAARTPLDFSWEAGSGAALDIKSIDPSADNDGNVLKNSDFELVTSNLPTSWKNIVGTPGQDILDGTSQAYFGSHCLRFTQYAGAPLSSIIQPFDGQTVSSVTGTPYTILPNTVYGVSFRAKRSAGLTGAGAMEVALTDLAGATIVQDNAGNDCKVTQTLSTLGTTYGVVTTFFRTPRALPATGCSLRVRLSTAIADSGASVYTDYLAMSAAVRSYPLGPLTALHSGGTPWAFGDRITLAISNNYAGKFVRLLERLFGLTRLGVRFPTALSPTIPDY